MTWVNERHLGVNVGTVVDHFVRKVRSELMLIGVDLRVVKRGVTRRGSVNLMMPTEDVRLL
jgi:hypothetical protein